MVMGEFPNLLEKHILPILVLDVYCSVDINFNKRENKGFREKPETLNV